MSTSSTWDRIFDGPPIVAPPGEVGYVSNRGREKVNKKMGRADIQGLRAVAVVLVILDHFGSWPHGGFVGVDVFFVISGFLITGVLLRSATEVGGPGAYFRSFYAGRVRRILPAAITVLVASLIAAHLVFRGARVAQTQSDFWWSFGFAANIHYAHIGTDYFQSTLPPSLMQHYWSLAVEEQFYVVWPIVILVVLALIGRRRRGSLSVLLFVVSALTVASFVWATHETRVNPTGAYFSTFVRAWELGVGATLAVAVTCFPRMTEGFARYRGQIALVAVLGIVVTAALIRSNSQFPAPAAAAPVLLTALVILVGTGQANQSRWIFVLTNRASCYVGDISYSLYLWHWPTIIIVGALVSRSTYPTLYYSMIVCAVFGLSVFSYHFIENPIRHRSGADTARIERRTAGMVALAAMALVVATLGLYAFKPTPAAPGFVPAVASASTPSSTADASIAPTSRTLRTKILAALGATRFPQLRPNLDGIGERALLRDIFDECPTRLSIVSSCTFGVPLNKQHSGKLALVIGDSISVAWMPAVSAALAPDGWTIVGFEHGGCPDADITISNAQNPNASASCAAYHRAIPGIVRMLSPSLVILSSVEIELDASGGNPTESAREAAYRAGLVKTVRAVSAPHRSVITLSPPPIGKSLLDCDTAGSAPANCVASISDNWYAMVRAERSAAQATKTRFINTRPWFCSDGGYCPAFVGTTPMRYDGDHITKAYAIELKSDMANALLRK